MSLQRALCSNSKFVIILIVIIGSFVNILYTNLIDVRSLINQKVSETKKQGIIGDEEGMVSPIKRLVSREYISPLADGVEPFCLQVQP
jgi:hypothetical protein